MKLIAYKKVVTIVIAGGLMLQVYAVHAQLSNKYLQAADKYFKKADYSSASLYYEKYLQGSVKLAGGQEPYVITGVKKAVAPGNKAQAKYRLAESYRMLALYAKAAPLYRDITENNVQQYPLSGYHYAMVLRALARYEEAEQAIQLFLDNYKNEDSDRVNAKREQQNLRFIQQQLKRADTTLYTVTKLGENKEGASYAPVFAGKDTLLFTATWQEGSNGHTNHLLYASYTNGMLGAVNRAGLPATDMHEGAASLSGDERTLYLTRWLVKEGKKTAAVYKSKKGVGGQWEAPVALNNFVNTPGFSSQQPFLMPDNKQLLFVSDKPGGQGGYDLWIAALNENGDAVSVVNAGATINTPQNEQAPFYHPASGTLVFASDGRIGMGGYDLFYSKGVPGSWSVPANFGYPINSVKDDMYFASCSKGDDLLEQVVLSSDRSAVCCLELLQLQKKVPVEVAVAVPAKRDTAVEAKVNLIQTAEPAVVTGVQETIPEKGKEALQSVFFELNKAALTPVSYPALDKIAEWLKADSSTRVEISGHTDDTGSEAFNQQLSEERAKRVVDYLVGKGVAGSRLTAAGYGARKPMAPNKNADGSDNPAGREKNRRTEMKIYRF